MSNIISPLIIGLILCALTVWMNIQIKFAASKDELITTYKKVFMGIAVILIFCANFGVFIFEMFTTEPLTRLHVALMVTSIANCISLFTAVGFFLLLQGIKSHFRTSVSHVLLTDAMGERLIELEKKVREINKAKADV